MGLARPHNLKCFMGAPINDGNSGTTGAVGAVYDRAHLVDSRKKHAVIDRAYSFYCPLIYHKIPLWIRRSQSASYLPLFLVALSGLNARSAISRLVCGRTS